MKLPGINLDRIAAFVAVADAGSFTAAAERLDMTKSGISHAVALLERELGAQLLQRSTRKLAITEAGTAFLADCRALLNQADAAVERARTGHAQLSGTLRLSSTQLSVPQMAQWIMQYCALYPQMRIDFVPTDQQVDLIADRFDLGVRIGPMHDSRLRAAKLAELALWVVASPDYLARRGMPRKPEDLTGHESVALSILSSPWTYTFTLKSGRKVKVRMHGAVSAANSPAVKSLVMAGAGFGIFPDSTVRAEVESGQLIRLLPQCSLQKLFLYAVYPGTGEPPAKTRAFIDLAREQLKKNN